MLQSYIIFIASLGLIFYLILNWGEIIGVRGTEGYIIPITSLGLHQDKKQELLNLLTIFSFSVCCFENVHRKKIALCCTLP